MIRRILSFNLGLLALTAFSAAAFDMDAMTESEREAFRAEIRAYLMDDPQVLMDAIEVLEERQAAEQAAGDAELLAAHADALFEDEASFVGGNPEGDVTVVEFLDYRCGYCRRAHPEVAQLLESDGEIRLIVKEFPILGEQSMLASRFAIATRIVAGDEGYAAVNDALMTERGDVTPETLEALANDLSLDWSAIRTRMDSDEVSQVIADNHALGRALQINGTPSFVFGDQMVRGYVPLDAMQQIVDEQREAG